MNDENDYANHNFIGNGDFTNGLDKWAINDEKKVTRQEGLWEGRTIGFMNTVNMGEGDQTIHLAELPRPTCGRADYKLKFHYEAVSGAEGTLRINTGLGGEKNLRLVPSLEAEHEQTISPDGLLLELNLAEYIHPLELDAEEQTVKFTVISPDNGGPGRPGAVRVAFVEVELLLEPLRLSAVKVDDEPQSPNEKLHLCFGASHKVALQLASDSVWAGTQAGLLLDGGVVDPSDVLNACPDWGQEHPVAESWEISCAGVDADREIERTLAVRSQYTADTYPLNAVCGHFQLDVVMVKEAAWYPVIDLNQSVELRVRVESHYTKTPLANREVTWLLKDPNGGNDVVLCRQPSDEKGEAGLIWTPDTAGDWQIEASVDSHYKKEEARYSFAVRVLKEDPWLSARFALDGLLHEWIWGRQTGYPCRGATHEVSLAFSAGHALAETELALHWQGEDTPDGLGMAFTPDLEGFNPVEGPGQKWKMVCGNRRDSLFRFSVSCSKLITNSPLQELVLAHNWLAIGDVKLPTRFPSVGGSDLRLEVQILSQVSGLAGVTGIEVEWFVGENLVATLLTGDDGWCVYPFSPVEEGIVNISARVTSSYDGLKPEHVFKLTVLAEDPWNKLVTVTLNGRQEEKIGLLCFRDAEPVDLLIMPGDDTLLDEDIYLVLTGENGQDLGFDVDPPPQIQRTLTEKGLVWTVRSNAKVSVPFQLHVCHDELTPFELQGRLLSKNLEEEGTFSFDKQPLPFESTAYPCLGGDHTLSFTPGTGSLLTGLEVAAKWVDESSPALNVKLAPDFAQDLPSGGLEWTLDARDSIADGTLGLALELPQARFTYPAIPMLLGHNRIEIADVRGPTFDLVVGENVYLEIKNRSYYTGRSVPGLEVRFSHGGTSTPVPTLDTGWARFPFTATQPGNVQVVATVPSPYDHPDDPPSFTFDITVLTAADVVSDSSGMSPSTLLPDEAMLISEQSQSRPFDFEIGEVREPSFDPVVGESVWMGLKVRSSISRRSVAGVTVVFKTGQDNVRVKTDSEGWALFTYKALEARDIQVVATLDNVKNGVVSTQSHTFSFKSLAAGVWDDALIQLNPDSPKTVWGKETLFPRLTQTHTIRLSVDNSTSHLLGRDIRLGLKGYSSPRDLGLTSVQPPLGEYQKLTTAGLSWQISGTKGGAFGLQVEASRLLNLSPVNSISLGPVPPADLTES
ncbi:Bacterial Ig-like domain (group 1) [compost metagenome]